MAEQVERLVTERVHAAADGQAVADEGVQDAMATLEGEQVTPIEDVGDFDPGDLAARRRDGEHDADTDDYEVVPEPTGLVPRDGGERALSGV